ncbi:MAG: SDR family oxidoreductase [Chitinivibrionales bacterium]|nr:SDR family oxidoreductase [Chitinivibrionales bacterium]
MSQSRKIALVTGGSRGIGKAIVKHFAAADFTVYFTYHKHTEAAFEVARSFNATGIPCSQDDWSGIEQAVDDIVHTESGLDVLVNNAGITDDNFIMMMPAETWHRVIDTNLNGAWRWSKAASRSMISRKCGSIINLSSVSGLIGIPGQTNYAASKGAIIAFTRSLAAELGPKGIRVNCIVPGFVESDMTARMQRHIKRRNLERILLNRFGSPDEIASVALFLASDKASYIVGQTIVVDGGLSSTVS